MSPGNSPLGYERGTSRCNVSVALGEQWDVIRSLGLALLVSVALASGSAGTVAAPPSVGVVPAATVFAAPAAAPTDVTGSVTYIADGDTVHVTDPLGSKIKVRVLGIDTPETRNPQLPVQCWGPEATQFATATLLNKQVT